MNRVAIILLALLAGCTSTTELVGPDGQTKVTCTTAGINTYYYGMKKKNACMEYYKARGYTEAGS